LFAKIIEANAALVSSEALSFIRKHVLKKDTATLKILESLHQSAQRTMTNITSFLGITATFVLLPSVFFPNAGDVKQ